MASVKGEGRGMLSVWLHKRRCVTDGKRFCVTSVTGQEEMCGFSTSLEQVAR